jgi:transposase InsO family protein
VNRVFHAPAPNVLWLSDFTYVSTWSGMVYVAFVIDVYARRIVGWRVSRTAHVNFVQDALEQALHERHPVSKGGLVHHSDRGSQYVSIRYTERLAEAGIEPSVGSIGDSYDNALADFLGLGTLRSDLQLGSVLITRFLKHSIIDGLMTLLFFVIALERRPTDPNCTAGK